MASLTVYRSSEICANSVHSLSDFKSKRGFRVFGQGSKSVETATNHRGRVSSQQKSEQESSHIALTKSVPEMDSQPRVIQTVQKANSIYSVPPGATPAPKGFFMKKRQCPVSMLDSKSSMLPSPGSATSSKFAVICGPTLCGVPSESASSQVKSSPTSSLTKYLPSRTQNCGFKVRHSVSPQSLGADRRALGIPKLHSADLDSSMSQIVKEESVSTTRRNPRPSSRKIHNSNNQKLLKEMLMNEDWQNQTFELDQIQALTAVDQNKSKRTVSCLKTHTRRSVGPKYRSAVFTELTYCDLTTERQGPPTHVKKVSFSANVLVYLY